MFLRRFLKLLTVFVSGGLAYGAAEVLSRGYTYISMGIIGGICMLIVHLLGDERRKGMSLFTVMLVSTAFITSAELLTGEVLNRRLGLHIWSYSSVPLNFDGQICVHYSLVWFAISFVAVIFDEWLRLKIFREKCYPIFADIRKRTAKNRL